MLYLESPHFFHSWHPSARLVTAFDIPPIETVWSREFYTHLACTERDTVYTHTTGRAEDSARFQRLFIDADNTATRICSHRKNIRPLVPLTFLSLPYAATRTTGEFLSRNLAICFQLCTVTHFVGFLPLPWFSCSLVFFPYSWISFGGFFMSCIKKKVGGLYLFVCKNYISLTCLNGLLTNGIFLVGPCFSM